MSSPAQPLEPSAKTWRIAVVIGSTRPNRICPGIAAWARDELAAGSALRYELVDLAEIDLPFLDEPLKPALARYEHDHTRAWSERIAAYDGFVFVFPQYNWGYPAALKNALDFLYREWHGKLATSVTYGTRGGNKGADQVEQVFTGLHMRVLSSRIEVVVTDDDVDEHWQLRDLDATMRPYARQIRELDARLTDALAGEDADADAQPRRTDALGLEVAEMRELGYWVVDRVVEHFERGRDGPAIATASADTLAEALGGPIPEHGEQPLAAMQALVEVALANMQHGDHPRYFARVPGPSSFAGVLGDWLGTGFNTIATSWAGASGPASVELIALDWLRELLGLPEGTEALTLSGGSLSNMTALAAARDCLGAGVAYLSDQTHASISRALRALGFARDEVRVLRSDECLRLTAAAVANAVAEDRGAGRTPRFIVATAGTTNTGAVDELSGLAELAAKEGMWLHVDGAYGAPAALTARGAAQLAGIERADSLVLDPHKWLFQPYDVGCLFVRRRGVLERAFSMRPEYLADVRARDAEVNFGDRSLELTRRSRALKLWLTLRIHGAAGLRGAIERGVELAEHAERLLHEDPRWEVVTPAQLGIVTFAGAGWESARHAAVAAAVSAQGTAVVTSTTLRGRSVLRLCTINPLTTELDIAQTLDRLATSEYL